MTPAEKELIERLRALGASMGTFGSIEIEAARMIEAQAARIAKMQEDESELLLIAYLNGAAQAAETIRRLRTALADAIRRPMGVTPDSAVGLISDREMMEAEERRAMKGGSA